MTAELIYRFTNAQTTMQTHRIILVDDADLAERMALTVATNAIERLLSTLNGKEPNWENNTKFTPEQVAETRKELDIKEMAAWDSKKRLEEAGAFAIKAGEAVVDLCNILEYATAGLDNITKRKDAKGMRETARDVISGIKAKMVEFNKQNKIEED